MPAEPRRRLSAWPRYDAAVLGFRNYWYPVTWSRRVGRRPAAFTLLGQPVMLLRERGRIVALVGENAPLKEIDN